MHADDVPPATHAMRWAPAERLPVAQTISRLRRQARCVVRDVTLVRASEDATLPVPMLSALSQTLELERVKVR